MSGARSAPRSGKTRLAVRIRRLDRSKRYFTTYLFVQDGATAFDIIRRAEAKYSFPIFVEAARVAESRYVPRAKMDYYDALIATDYLAVAGRFGV